MEYVKGILQCVGIPRRRSDQVNNDSRIIRRFKPQILAPVNDSSWSLRPLPDQHLRRPDFVTYGRRDEYVRCKEAETSRRPKVDDIDHSIPCTHEPELFQLSRGKRHKTNIRQKRTLRIRPHISPLFPIYTHFLICSSSSSSSPFAKPLTS